MIPLAEIERARERIAGAAVRTPLVRLPNTDIWLKLENLQPIASFKLRGAANRVLSAQREDVTRGLVTTSTGNIVVPASTRGVIRKEIESKARVSSASICSVTLMEPISAVIVAPTFPASTSADKSGTSSSKTDLITSCPTTERGIQS